MRKCNDESMEEDRVPEIQNDCSLDKDIIPQLPHTVSEILDAVTMLKTIEDSKKIICHLMDCHQIISLDVKGRDLGTDKGKISLIAVGTCNGQCLLFDIHCNNELVIKGRLKNMLQCEELIKVMHDCCLIRSALKQCFGVKINSIFDTQCAHAVIEGHRCGKNPRYVSPETLLFISTSYGRGVLTPAAHVLERLYLENSNFWDTRPLPCKLTQFAASGVLALLPEVYNNMNRRLCGPLRQTFRTLCHGKCIEPAEHDALQVQKSSLKDSCNEKKKSRSISGDCRCRSCSLISQSSNQSDNNEACAKCGSFDWTCPPKSTRKTPCVVPRFKIPKRSCASKKKKRNCKSKSLSNVCLSSNKTGSVGSCISPKNSSMTKSSTLANCSCSKHTSVKSKVICRDRSKRTKNCQTKKLSPVKILAGKKRSVTLKANNDSLHLGLVRSGWKAQMEMESQMNNQNEEIDEVKSKVICRNRSTRTKNCHTKELSPGNILAGKKRYVTLKEDNDSLHLGLVRGGWKAQMGMESQMNNQNEEMDEGEQNVSESDDDEEEFEKEILSPVTKRKR